MEYQSLNIDNYQELMEKYQIGSLLAKVVSSFQYDSSELDSFFSPKIYETLKAPCLKDFHMVINDVMKSGKKVFVFGDYDCDGICATAIMVSVLNKLNISNGYYIPNRFTEGYGLNLKRLKQAKEKGYDVLITVDNGVAADEALKWAKENDMTVIVTDHHIIEREVVCDVLCHPTILPEPFHYLCGAGVAYVIADYLGLADYKIRVLAMVATIADVMELKGFNVQLVKEGLQLVHHQGDKHLESLLNESLDYIDENDVAFKIAPRINAVGRMADIANPNQVVSFLLSNNPVEINHLAFQINEINAQRKSLTNQQYAKVKEAYDSKQDFPIIYIEGLHEGVVGSMASRLSSEVNKPCLIFTNASGLLKGSGRGVKGMDLEKLLLGFKEHTLAFGGHKQACGITIVTDKLDLLRQYIDNNYLQVAAAKEVLDINLQDLNLDNLTELFEYKPFGQGRKLPLFRLTVDSFQNFNKLKNEQQLKWQVFSYLSILSFSNNEGYSCYQDSEKLRIIAELKENRFRNVVNYVLYPEEIIKL